MTSKIPTSLAALVTLRAGRRCEYCRAPQIIIGQTFHVEHIIPRSAAGKTVAENLCLACSHCNFAKGARLQWLDPRTGKKVRLFNPRTDDWETHFRWSRDWQRVIGRSAIGRATVAALDMNAKLLQEARPFWRLAGRLA